MEQDICIAALVSSAITNLIWVVVFKIMSRRNAAKDDDVVKVEMAKIKPITPPTKSIQEQVESVIGHYEKPSSYKDATWEELREAYKGAKDELFLLYEATGWCPRTIPEKVTETFLNRKIDRILRWMNYRTEEERMKRDENYRKSV